ncbi:Protein RALF-like 22 [Plenodomus biglobosus]|nr:Protein RALF-like 22 [Plenodomus biglobosus]
MKFSTTLSLALLASLGAAAAIPQPEAQEKKVISYGALNRNNVPCSRRGASYQNCRAGAKANDYSRGCSTGTRCNREGK